jgi:hypothetical protein
MTLAAIGLALFALGIAVGTALRVNALDEQVSRAIRGTIEIVCEQAAVEEYATDLRIRALEARLSRLERSHEYTPSRN